MDAVLIGMLLYKPIDFLHLDNLPFHPGNLADARYPPLAIGKSLELNDNSYCRRDCTPNAAGAHPDPAIATICSSRFIASRGVFA